MLAVFICGDPEAFNVRLLNQRISFGFPSPATGCRRERRGQLHIKCRYRLRGTGELRPENPAYPVLTFRDGAKLEVWGVVGGVERHYGGTG